MHPRILVAPLALLLFVLGSATGVDVFERGVSAPTVRSTLVSPPSDAARPVVAELLGVSCVGSEGCGAVGAYQRPGELTAPMATEVIGGRGVDPRAVPLPPSAVTPGSASLTSVSCKTVHQCVAVGSYSSPRSRSGNQLPMVAISVGGLWQRAIAVALPDDAASGAMATGYLGAVTCTGTIDCVAVGSFTTREGHERAFRVAISPRAPHGAVSRGVELPFAPLTGVNGAGAEYPSLSGVSCWAPSDCIAVGSVSGRNGHRSVAITEETRDTRWMPEVTAPLPPAIHRSTSNTWLYAVSCPTPGRCIAVGSAQVGSSSSGLVTTRVRAGWRSAPLLTGAGGGSVQLQSVACVTGSTACTATGYVTNDNDMTPTGVTTAVLSVGTVSSLPSLLNVTLPTPAGGVPNVKELLSLSCPRAASCTAVGAVAAIGGHVIAYKHPAVATVMP